MNSLNTAPASAHKDSQQKSETPALEEHRKETISSQPRRHFLKTPQNGHYVTLPNRPHSAPKSFNPPTPHLDVPVSSSATSILPERSKKRQSNGEVKQMVAELAARADLTMSRERAVTPEHWKSNHDLSSPGYWGNDWELNTLRRYPTIMSYSPKAPRSSRSSRSLKGTHPVNGRSKDVEENAQDNNSGKRKRQGSLLEWRHKEMFEEPVRI